jgi:hypothetical protein
MPIGAGRQQGQATAAAGDGAGCVSGDLDHVEHGSPAARQQDLAQWRKPRSRKLLQAWLALEFATRSCDVKEGNSLEHKAPSQWWTDAAAHASIDGHSPAEGRSGYKQYVSGQIQQFSKLLSAELETEQMRSSEEVTQLEYQFANKGSSNSGARLVQMGICLSEGIIRYRRCIFEKWTTYIRPRLPELSDADRGAFVEAALSAIDAAIAGAQAHYRSRPVTSILTGPLDQIAQIGGRERALLEAELGLYMSTPTVAPSQNIHVSTLGTNSPVNVGSGTIHQRVHVAEGMGELVRALGALLDTMAQSSRSDMAELREILVEAKEEAAKPQPNRLRLSSILAGCRDIVQTVGSWQPAWEAVHRAGQLVGAL